MATKNNKIIARFMGDNFCTNFQVGQDYHDEGWLRKSDDSYYDNLYYHSSWNWIMPVVQKIEKILANGDIPNYFTTKGYTYWMNRFGKRAWVHEAVYIVVIDFIKWYNKYYKK